VRLYYKLAEEDDENSHLVMNGGAVETSSTSSTTDNVVPSHVSTKFPKSLSIAANCITRQNKNRLTILNSITGKANNFNKYVQITRYRSMRQPLTAQRLSSTRITKRTLAKRACRRTSANDVNVSPATIEDIAEQASTNPDNIVQSVFSHETLSSMESSSVEALPDTHTASRRQSDKQSPTHLSKPTRSKRSRRRRPSTPSHTISSNTAQQILDQAARTCAHQKEGGGQSLLGMSSSMTPIIVEDLPDIRGPQPSVLGRTSQARVSKSIPSGRRRRNHYSSSYTNTTEMSSAQELGSEPSDLGVSQGTELGVAITDSTILMTDSDIPESNPSQPGPFNHLGQRDVSQSHSPPSTSGDPAATASNNNRIPRPQVSDPLEEELNIYLNVEGSLPGFQYWDLQYLLQFKSHQALTYWQSVKWRTLLE